MSEVASRPAPTRGRGTTRGRGGFRGSARPRHTNGDVKESQPEETEQGEIGELKKTYSSQLKTLKELFADWTEVDLLLALQETDGDLERTIDHISEGNVSQFSDVKKKAKDRSRSKAVDSQQESTSRPSRGRGGAVESGRGGRGRTERGRGAPRTGRGGHATESRAVTSPTSIPTAESSTWADSGAWGESAPAAAPVTKAAAEPIKSAPAPASTTPAQKTWASMFAKPKPEAKTAKPSAAESSPTQEAGAVPSSDISSGYVEVTHSDADTEPVPQLGESITSQEPSEVLDQPTIEIDDSNVTIPPTKDKLTEDNVETLPDVSQPAPVGTAASEVESSRGPDSTAISVVATPSAPIPIGRPAIGGFATTAQKATSSQGRSASFQRRLLEQKDAVVMPGNHAVDRAAVQFGSLGLNGDISSLDVDEDREELETRAQPPQHSPVAQPKTALPPAPRQEAPLEQTIKPAPGLPQPAAQQSGAQHAGSSQLGQAGQSQAGHGYNQFGRYGQTQDAASQKQNYDPFGQQQSQQSQYDSYGAQTQAPSQTQQTASSQLGGFPSATNDYYTPEQRNAYQNHYGYGQQAATSQQDAGAAQQRTGSAFGAQNDSSFAASQSQQSQSRFGETQASNTPASAAGGAQHQATAGQAQASHPGHAQQQSYPYNHPYYNQPYYQAYMNQYQGYGQQGFGPYGGKGGMYGHPQQHGFGAPQSGYDQHSSSPAQAGSFGGREAGLGAGLNSEYSRSGSAQPNQSQAAATGGYGNDGFGRSPGTYPSQAQQYGQSGNEDSLKPFGDKATAGSNSGSLGQPGRPTSATNSNQTGQGGLPPPQSHAGYGGYPSQFQQGGQAASQYGSAGLGGLGGAGQSHQQGGGYAGYGQGQSFGNNYQQYGQQHGQSRGGWGGQYGQQH